MSDEALAFLAERPLFSDLDPGTLRHLSDLMVPFSLDPGETLFAEGQTSHRMYIVEHGRLEVSDRLPGDRRLRMGEIGAGGILGEMALLRGIEHAATAVALEPTSGYAVGRNALGVLTNRSDIASLRVTRLIGSRATALLRREYEVLARTLGTPPPPAEVEQAAAGRRPASDDPEELAYLAGLPFFEDFEPEEVAAVVAGMEWRWADRGAVLVAEGSAPDALLLVVHGAVEATLRGDGHAARVLLAGPGRCAVHLGVLDDGPSPVMCRARERCVLVVLPREHVRALFHSDRPLDRRLVRALYHDAVGAVEQAQRPLARLAASGVDPGTLGEA